MNESSRLIRTRPAVAVAMLLASAASWGQSLPQYQVAKVVPLGMPDRWDYVVFDSDSHRVYVSHGDRVTVVDGRNGSVLGAILNLPGGTHGIAISTSTGRGYTDDGGVGEAASFDLKSLKITKRIKAAEDADAIAFDSISGHVFVVNGDSGTITVIDSKSDSGIATIEVGGKLEYATADNAGKLYVNNEARNEIDRIDIKSNQVDARWPIPACERPHGLAMDRSSRRLFSGCENSALVVANADTGQVVATVPIGSGSDAVVFDAKRKLIFSSNGRDGTLSVIQEKDPQTFISLGEIKTAPLARTMALDADTGRIYLVAADIDPNAIPATAAPKPGSPPPRRMPIVPGSVKLLIYDPVK